MKRLVLNIDKDIDIKPIIKKEIDLNTDNKRGVYEKEVKSGGKTTYFFMYEEYFVRINSDLTVTIIAEETSARTTVELIASGGGIGPTNSNFGSEESSIKELKKTLKSLGFEEVK